MRLILYSFKSTEHPKGPHDVHLFNYKALDINTPLTKNIQLSPQNLEEFINSFDGGILYHGFYELEARDRLAGYAGIMQPAFETLHFDLDSRETGGAPGTQAWIETKALCNKLSELGIDYNLYFSGNKGFHIGIHMSAFGITGPMQAEELKALVKGILYTLKKTYSTLDTDIHEPVRKFRAYKSKHEKTGLYKIRLNDAGITESPLTLELETIKKIASIRQDLPFSIPKKVAAVSEWALDIISESKKTSVVFKKGEVVEIPQGTMFEDASLKFKTFEGKKCITSMLDGTLFPQFNRHDIEIRIIYEFRQRGVSYTDASSVLTKWATKTYKDEPARAEDFLRQLNDAYKQPIDGTQYSFGCYDPIKQAYCSGRCKLYKQLDPTKRAEPIDVFNVDAKLNMQRYEIVNESGQKLSEGEIADKILASGEEIIKSDNEYFQWAKTHWERKRKEEFESELMKICMETYGNKASVNKVESLKRHVIAKIHVAPENNHFFDVSKNKFNFADCTVHVIRHGTKLKLEYLPHSKEDYIAYCNPYPIKEKNYLPKGTLFDSYMAARREDLGEEGIRVIKQMLGAALVPYIPRIFFLEGESNSGKSTLAKLITYLIGPKNISFVSPEKKFGNNFIWEETIGKIANIVFELDRKADIDFTTLKMVRDKMAVSINRKGLKGVSATLPFLHIYCCNQMPSSLEGNSGALDNRVTILSFKKGYLNGASGVLELSESIWETDGASVLEAAKEGLADLVASNFVYFESEKSKSEKKEWQEMTDPISRYFFEINNKEWDGPKFEGSKFELGSTVYEDFALWCADIGCRVMGKHFFYRELERRFKVPVQADARGGKRYDFSGLIKNVSEFTRFNEIRHKSDIKSDTLSY